MTKHLRFLIVLLLTLVWSVGWAQTTVFHETFDKCNSTGGNDGTWGAGFGGKELSSPALISQFLDNEWSNVSKVFIGSKCVKVSTTNDIGTLTTPLINSTGDFIIKIKAGGCTKKTPKINIKSSNGQLDKSSVSLTAGVFNDYSLELSGVTQAFTLTFSVPKSNHSFIDDIEVINKSTLKESGISFGKTTYTANITDKDGTYRSYVSLTNPNNLSVSYASSKTDVAEVNNNGEVKILGLGTTTISAAFAGDDTYAEATAKYTLNVIDPNKTDVTFDFTKPEDYGYANNSKTELSKGVKLESHGVVITNVMNGRYTTRFDIKKDNVVTFRVYVGAILTVEAPAGFAINKIDFTDDGSHTVDNFTFSAGELNSKTWTGLAETLTMKVAKNQVFLENMTVNLVKVETITLDESATNTLEAKAGVSVTLKRPMNVGRWNTFCVPFSIDATQVASQFGEGTQIAEYSVSINEIDFATVQSNAIVAGKAYLVKPTKEAATEGYTFSNVNITALEPTTETVDNGAIDFRGIYNPTDITVGLPANTFAAGIVGNAVKKAVSGSNMKGFRAFFIIPEGAGAQSSYMLKIDGTVTSINSINGADVVVNAPVYNLQGQHVDGNNLTPGIYVKAGKKFVVK